MRSDCDVALVGTGVAPLVAAAHLLAHGKRPLILNPDSDFFLENSELPMDPEWHFERSTPEWMLNTLRPDFPGAIEYWDEKASERKASEFRDALAPHVRARSRLWMSASASVGIQDPVAYWQRLESLFVESLDHGLVPQELHGLSAFKRFPGASQTLKGDARAILLPKLCDVDVGRYREGLRDYVAERLGKESCVTSVSDVQFIPGGVRYYASGELTTRRIHQGLVAFWTPRLTSWVLSRFRVPKQPEGVRVWEEWSLLSRDRIDPNTVGVFEEALVWADFEGAPTKEGSHDLFKILRPVQRVGIRDWLPSELGKWWLSGDSFTGLSRLMRDFLNWELFTVREVHARALLDWGQSSQQIHSFQDRKIPIKLALPSDGPLAMVVETARKSVEDWA